MERIHVLLLGLILVVFGSSWILAQNSDNDSKSKSNTRTITGCLSKEEAGNSKEFLLTANDGSTWEVRSDAVSLASHVGQTVTATGVVKNSTAHNLKEDAKDAASDAHMKKDNSEHGHLTITDVKMVDESCKQ